MLFHICTRTKGSKPTYKKPQGMTHNKPLFFKYHTFLHLNKFNHEQNKLQKPQGITYTSKLLILIIYTFTYFIRFNLDYILLTFKLLKENQRLKAHIGTSRVIKKLDSCQTPGEGGGGGVGKKETQK